MAEARPAGIALLVAALLIACDAPSIPSAAPAPTAGAIAPSGAAVGARSAEPSPLPASRPGVRGNAVGAIPELFRFVAQETELADGFRTRLWLIDLSSRRAPVVAAEWDAPAAPVGGYSASRDGRAIIVSAGGARARVALYLLRPVTGETRVLYEDASTVVVSARVSPDGAQYAFTKYPAQGGFDLGIWAGRVDGGELTRISEPSTASTVPQMPLAWSPDAGRLAFTRDLDRTEVRVVPTSGGPELAVGPGDRVSWRATAPELVIAEPVGPGSRVYTSDVATGRSTDLVKEDRGHVTALAWHPSGDRFAFVLTESASREASQGVWLWRTGGPGLTSLSVGGTIFAVEWSADGSILSALAGGDDARIPIVDLLTGRQLSVLCRRGGTPPADCL